MIKGIKPSLAQAGAIKIGRLSEQEYTAGQSGRKYRRPVKLDHFLVVRNERDDAGQLIIDEEIMHVLQGDPWADRDGKCRTIPILLHSDDIDEVFPTAYAAYAGKQIVCRGDGETATRWLYKDKVRTGQTTEMACPCPWLERDAKGAQHCKPHGTLHCRVALPGHAIAGAVYRWRTTGIVSIQRMIGSLEEILGLVGTLVNVPLVLRVQPVQVSPDGKSQTVYSCHVELRARDLVEVQQRALQARESRKLLGPPPIDMKLLVQAPASDDESPEERAEVEEEFYPHRDDQPTISAPGRTQAVKEAAKKTAAKNHDGGSHKQEPGDIAAAKGAIDALSYARANPPDEPQPTDEEKPADEPDYGAPDA